MRGSGQTALDPSQILYGQTPGRQGTIGSDDIGWDDLRDAEQLIAWHCNGGGTWTSSNSASVFMSDLEYHFFNGTKLEWMDQPNRVGMPNADGQAPLIFNDTEWKNVTSGLATATGPQFELLIPSGELEDVCNPLVTPFILGDEPLNWCEALNEVAVRLGYHRVR